VTDAEILAGVAAVAREHVGYEGELSPSQRLLEDLDLDSIKALTLAVEVENRFRVVIDPESEASIVTVGDLVRVVREKLDDAG
jgi:acyl carrier protein